MNERDALAEVIWGVEAETIGTFKTGVTSRAADNIADAVLAAGWRPPTPPAHAIEPAKSPSEDARAVISALTGRWNMIPEKALLAAKEAMREVTPPPGVTKTEWLAEHGSFALIAGAIAAAAPHMLAGVYALMEDPEHYDSQGPSNGYVSVDNLRAALGDKP